MRSSSVQKENAKKTSRTLDLEGISKDKINDFGGTALLVLVKGKDKILRL